MDPVTQGVLGASVAQGAAPRAKLAAAAAVGALAGMAPDLDVLIQSPDDPLLFLEYHRHFTHALAFIPFGALICAAVFHVFARRQLRFAETYLFCLLGYATHGLLDACTTYGTQLLWPFSSERIAWNVISVVDPLFTLPALALVLWSWWRTSPRPAWIAMAWMGLYMSFGLLQHERAETAGMALAVSRGHSPATVSAKPGFGNLLLWKVVYAEGEHFHVDAVRVGIDVTIYPGERAERLDLARHLPWLDADSQQARDIERFRWFSSDYLAVAAHDSNEIVDVRYSMLPNEIDPLWGIRVDRDAAADAHIVYFAQREATPAKQARLLAMLAGRPPLTPAPVGPAAAVNGTATAD